MLALVTGGHGFVGSHLCERLLRSGWSVRVLARPSSSLANLEGLDVEVMRGDLLDSASLAAAVTGVSHVFHVAAALRGLNASDLFLVNEIGTRNVVEACRRHAPRIAKFVLVSSLAAVGPTEDGVTPLDESAVPRPVSWYGKSKLAAERVVLDVAGDLPTVVARPPIVYGPRDRDVLALFRMAKRGFVPLLGPTERRYSLVHAADLARGLECAARAAVASGSVYFLTAPEVVSGAELARAIGNAVGREPRMFRVPEWLARAAGRGADLVSRARGAAHVFGSQKVEEMLQPGFVCSARRAASELGWRAEIALADGLDATAAWYAARGWL